jgi:hypothetical protein
MQLILIAFSCNQKKEITIESLGRQKWDTLGKGLSYVSTEESETSNDSLVYNLVATMTTDGTIEPVTNPSGWNHYELATPIEKHPQNSSAGYVRFNINEWFLPDTTRMNIYLSEPLNENYHVEKDSAILASIPGISSVRYISKSDARKKWLDEGNSDWEKVLENNPLPAMIEVDLDNRKWNARAMDSMKTIISVNIKTATDIQYPALLSQTGIIYHYFEYKKR